MSRVSTLNRPAVIKCPNCGVEAEADPIQLQGRCSLICPYCGFHFYITPKVDGIAQVVEGARVELAE
jgi:DNA-directed RNA polymerase subunit RPC12/RpoP